MSHNSMHQFITYKIADNIYHKIMIKLFQPRQVQSMTIQF